MQNGYQGQKRNIVDDAKFETKVNEEEKRNWINLVRHKSKGMCELNKNKIKFSIRWMRVMIKSWSVLDLRYFCRFGRWCFGRWWCFYLGVYCWSKEKWRRDFKSYINPYTERHVAFNIEDHQNNRGNWVHGEVVNLLLLYLLLSVFFSI